MQVAYVLKPVFGEWGISSQLSQPPPEPEIKARNVPQATECTRGLGLCGSHSHAEQLTSLHPSPHKPTSSPAFTSTPRESEQWDNNHSSQGVCRGSGPVCFSLEVTRSPGGAGKVERVSHIFPFVRVLISSII